MDAVANHLMLCSGIGFGEEKGEEQVQGSVVLYPWTDVAKKETLISGPLVLNDSNSSKPSTLHRLPLGNPSSKMAKHYGLLSVAMNCL